MKHLKIVQKTVLSVILFSTVRLAFSQGQDTASHKDKNSHFIVAIEIQRLRSTHSQTIYGGSVFIGVPVNSSFSAGIGCEISYTDSLYTHDKSTNIFFFRPIPVYGELRFIIRKNSRLLPYAHLAIGMSSISYRLERFDQTTGNFQTRGVHQDGFFVNAGAGILFAGSRAASPFAGVSFKSFHLSSNPYEINPHGVTLQVGVILRPSWSKSLRSKHER